MVKCCICGKEIKGQGNNPWPINKEPGKKCCDECNKEVIEQRIRENTFEKAATLLQEFDYKKNGREVTKDFLEYMLKEWI